MQLPGRLSASTLGDLLGALHRERTSGRLELSEIRGPRGASVPGRRHRIHLGSGLVTAVETDLPVPPLGEILRREGWVGSAVLSLLLRRLDAGDPRSTGEILVVERLARAEAVRVALEQQMRERLEAVFAIEDATIAFRTARPAGGEAWSARPLSPQEFLAGRPRRRDFSRAGTWPQGAARGPSRGAGEGTPEPPRSGTRGTIVDEARQRALGLLGVAPTAGAAEVRRAFRRLASELHPDVLGAAPEDERRLSAARFARISAAYHLLVA